MRLAGIYACAQGPYQVARSESQVIQTALRADAGSYLRRAEMTFKHLTPPGTFSGRPYPGNLTSDPSASMFDH